MNKFSMSCAIGAVLCISTAAFAQNNPPSSSTGLQAGDNAQTTTPSPGTTANAGMAKHKTMKHKKSGSSTPGMSAATPGGPAAPVGASGSGS
jgi:hypothetical protein